MCRNTTTPRLLIHVQLYIVQARVQCREPKKVFERIKLSHRTTSNFFPLAPFSFRALTPPQVKFKWDEGGSTHPMTKSGGGGGAGGV